MLTSKATKATRADAGAASAASGNRTSAAHATITSALAADPTLPPSVAAERLFPSPAAWRRGILRFRIKEQLEEGRGKGWNWHKGAVHPGNAEPADEELERVRQRFGYKAESEGGPSRLYLMILADALLPLPRNPMSGVVSPPLLATTGIVPFSIFSTGPDIIGHYYDCIVSARREVVLLTNYWQGGKNVDRIADALRELDRRQGERLAEAARKEGRQLGKPSIEERIIVKIMWDRGPQTLADLFRLRKPVPPGMWKTNGLPEEQDVPNIHVEILNYHRPLMGTFHAKLLLVDRQVALVNSNNIQDRPNIEGCTRLEGDIVNSVYDHALISWGNRLNPPLPCLGSPAPKEPSAEAFSDGGDGGASRLPVLTGAKLQEMAQAARARLQEEDEESEGLPEASSARRSSFALLVDGAMSRRSEGAIQPPPALSVPAAGAHADGPASAPAVPTGGMPSLPSPDGTTEHSTAEQDRATRRAGQLWAQKVLGERFAHLNLPHLGGSSGHSPTIASERRGSAPNAAPTGHSPPASPSLGPRRGFAEVVEAMMKKEGIKPSLWTEGALDAFGLGPSSSRNVAEDARKSRAARGQAKDANARGIDVPHAVSEEPGTGDAETFVMPARDDDNEKAHASPSFASTKLGEKLDKGEGVADDEQEPARLQLDSYALEREVSAPRPAAPLLQVNGDVAPDETPIEDDTASEAAEQGAPGSSAYRRKHARTLSMASRTSASERLAAITKSLDFANLSQVKGEITAEQLAAMQAGEGGGSSTSASSAAAAAIAAQAKAAEGEASSSASSGAAPKADILDFNPFIFHAPHAPVPMALVNRRPHGTPGHSDIRNAQDAAWLAGFRYARRHVFVQSPTLNATPIRHAVLHACRRGVRVELWLGLGFNDKSESMPFQGGTNEQVVTRLYRQLRREGKGSEKFLEVYWYTGKDMTRPLNAVRKQRNCHVKYAQFDDQVAIIGSGNQDTQSWYHSQEINVMLDSQQVVREWNEGLRRNQSTGLYGRVDDDGIWRGRGGAEKVDKGSDK